MLYILSYPPTPRHRARRRITYGPNTPHVGTAGRCARFCRRPVARTCRPAVRSRGPPQLGAPITGATYNDTYRRCRCVRSYVRMWPEMGTRPFPARNCFDDFRLRNTRRRRNVERAHVTISRGYLRVSTNWVFFSNFRTKYRIRSTVIL